MDAEAVAMQGEFHSLIITKAHENKDNNHNVLLGAHFSLHDRIWMLSAGLISVCTVGV